RRPRHRLRRHPRTPGMTTTPPSPAPSDIPMAVLFCVDCGYDLRGQSPDAACPECGTPVARSQLGDALWHSSPSCLWKLRLGAMLLTLSAVVSLIYRVSFWIIPMWTDSSLFVQQWYQILAYAGGIAITLLTIASTVLIA